PGNQNGHSGQESGSGGPSPSGGRAHLHRDENKVERAGTRRRAGQADGLFVDDEQRDNAIDGSADAEAHGAGRDAAHQNREHRPSGRGEAQSAAFAAQAEDERPPYFLPAADRNVPGKGAYSGVAAGDRTGVWGEAPYHGPSFDSENRAATAEG